MPETVFRSQSQGTSSTPPVDSAVTGGQVTPQPQIEVPYTDYIKQNNHPYTVDYYKLGSTWEDPDGGFSKEVSTIEDYLKDQIEKGTIANSVSAVKEKIKSLEKINGIDKEERTNLKISVVSAFVKFLQETKDVKIAIRKYGTK